MSTTLKPIDGRALILAFCETEPARATGVGALSIRYQHVRAPHTPAPLPARNGAVYVFALPTAGDCALAGRALKVGMAGPNSNPRFQSHHYGPSRAISTLARSILRASHRWEDLGIAHVQDATVGSWMKRCLERHHFFVGDGDRAVLPALESFLQRELNPLFEGRPAT